MKKKYKTFSLCVLVFAVILAGCSSKKETNTPQDKSSQEENDQTGSTEIQENEDIKVETTYGVLSYPYGFEEIVDCVKEEAGDVEKYIFYAVVNEEKIKVYTITFSEESLNDSGEILGTIQSSSDAPVNVYFLPENEIVNDDMTDDDKNTVYAAQETANDIIASLNDLSEFVPGTD